MVLLFLALHACSGKAPSDTGGADTDDTGSADTGDEVEAVWEEDRVSTSARLQGVYVSESRVYVVGTLGQAWRSDDEGWDDLNPRVGESDLTDIWGEGSGDELEIFATATEGNIAHYVDGDWSSEDVGTSNHEGIGGSGPGELYAVSWGGVYRFDGATWTFENPPNNERLNEVYAEGDEAVAVGEAGAILRREGGVWQSEQSGASVNLNAVDGTALDDVWAVGEEGVALHFDGSDWSEEPTGVTTPLLAVYAESDDTVYAVGTNGVALRWNGDEWLPLPTGVANNLYAVDGQSGEDVWAVGNAGMVLKYED